MESNFTFLRERFPVLARFGEQAERYFRSDANSCLMKLGMIGETIVHLIYDTDGIELPVPDDAVHRIRRLAREPCRRQECQRHLIFRATTPTAGRRDDAAVHRGKTVSMILA